MIEFDETQRAVRAFDLSRHARVLGAPGTGKTRLIVDTFARCIEDERWSEEDLLILATNRQVAASLRSDVELRVHRALGDAPARTAASFAFALLKHAAATEGHPVPRLLTGTAQDEILAGLIDEALAVKPAASTGSGGDASWAHDMVRRFTPEVLRSEVFRSEVRELMRVLDDFSVSPDALGEDLVARIDNSGRTRYSRGPSPELAEQWRSVLPMVSRADGLIARTRPHDLTSSGLLRAATLCLLDRDDVRVPRLILVDDAQELREGELALISACVRRGSTVWLFGDPDIATGAFRGEHTRVLTRFGEEVRRKLGERGVPFDAATTRTLEADAVQSLVLTRVHRHGETIRGLVQNLTGRIGAAGAGAQREATGAPTPGTVRFAQVSSTSEQIGAIAHRLRQRRLGLGTGKPVAWGRMAVICRSRGEASRAERALGSLQVPTGAATGGMVLREHPIVHDLVMLLRHALGIREIEPGDIPELLTGIVGGIDRIALRRLRGELRLRETRDASHHGREARRADDLLAQGFLEPAEHPLVDSGGGRALHRLATIARAAARTHASGGTPRETLWTIWEGSRLASRLQDEALTASGVRSDDAHRHLDAVLGLFFVLQRHEEQDSAQPIADVLDEVLSSSVPEDSLAERSRRDTVTVTTPQGVIGQEYDLVCVLGPQDGEWPNLRTRGSLLGVTALEQWLRGMDAVPPARRDTLHDELRLFAQSCARATEEILTVAVRSESQHPSAFFGFGVAHEVEELPTSRLTLRGAVAEMRRRLARDHDDAEAAHSLALLARHGIPGAEPDDWYGVRRPSTDEPLTDLAADPDATVRVRPSHIDAAERCALSWVIQHLGGGSSIAIAQLGTILHRALEHAEGPEVEPLMQIVDDAWNELDFEAEWESQATRAHAELMVRGVGEYLAEFQRSDRDLIGREARFALQIGRALIVGTADRLERRARADGSEEVTVVDLKTGAKKPSAAERQQHIQMQAYQMGIVEGAFTLDDGSAMPPAETGGARLLFVHPQAVGKTRLSPEGYGFIESVQEPLASDARERFVERVRAAAEVMAGREFIAQIEHHCGDRFALGRECRIHIIPAVSHA